MISTKKAKPAGNLQSILSKPAYGFIAPLDAALALPLLALALSAATCWVFGMWWDNDINYIIALGRSIITDGLPWVDTLTCNDGLHCIAQQWVFCIAAAALCDNIGPMAVSALVFGLWCIATILIYKACGIAGAAKRTASLLTAFAIVVCLPFIKTNPRALDVCAFVIAIIATAKWLDGSRRALIVPVIASAAMANLHCTMWPVAAIPLVAAMFDARATGRRHEIVICGIATSVASAFSPYGIWSSLYVFLSMGPGLAALGIGELKAPQFGTANLYNDVFLCAVLVYVFIRARKGDRISYYDALFALMAAMAFSQLRNGILFWPVVVYAFAHLLADKTEDAPTFGLVVSRLAASAVLIFGIFGVLSVARPDSVWHSESRSAAIEALENAGVQPGSAVLNSFGTGGWIELAGFKPAYDERAELFLSQVNGGKDLAAEMVRQGRYYPADVVDHVSDEKYDACIFNANEVPYYEAIMGDAGYYVVYSDDNLTAWARNR